ncbi:hypothetical protein [uncultured Chryseobacterium sp.]|uniref:hypothetical protein n=1 Tax=uncultured Chryseobacterium sp. TaxID=259322 RepID=UPI0025CF3CB0|nr:hypothetical protein [uncultured Chryseobacterium sp.]
METKKFWSDFIEKWPAERKTSAKIKEGAKVLAVGILALLALGFFTTSQRLNAG